MGRHDMNVPRGQAAGREPRAAHAAAPRASASASRTPTPHLSADEARRYKKAARAKAASASAHVPLKRIAAVCCLALALCGVGGAFAWFSGQDSVLNVFTNGKVDPVIGEAFDAAAVEKKDVKVTNEGTADAYVRATVSVYWEDDAGNQLWEAPIEGTDYTMDWGDTLAGQADPRWIAGADGYYYWSQPVGAKGSTANLIDVATRLTQPQGKHLVVDIATQALQANQKAFDDAWAKSSGLRVDADGRTLVEAGAPAPVPPAN